MSETHVDSVLPAIPLTELIPELPKQYNYEAGIECALQGKGYREIAEALGTTRLYLRELRIRYSTFNDILARARAWGLDELFDDLRFVVEDNPEIDHRKIRVKFEATKYYLACSDPRKYGDRMNIEVTEHVDLKGSMEQARTRVLKQIAQAPAQADAELSSHNAACDHEVK